MAISILTFGLLIWFEFLQPAMRRRQIQKHLRPGVKVVTAGGIVGTVKSIYTDAVIIQVSKNQTVLIDKNFIISIAS